MGILDKIYGGSQFGLGEDAQADAKRRALLAISQSLLQSGGPSRLPQNFGSIAGAALGAGQQANDQSYQNALQAALLKQKMSQPKERGKLVSVMGPNGKPVYMYEDEAAGKEAFVNEGTQGRTGYGFGNINPGDYTPESLKRYQASGDLADLQRYVTPATPMSINLGGAPSIVTPSRTGANPIIQQLSTPEAERDAASERIASETTSRETAQEQSRRDINFSSDMAKIDDEIARTQRLLKEFKEGKYQTGPLASKLPNFRTAAQDLAREQGKDVLTSISSATFGALSEGERAFLRELGISESANEKSNINLLEQRLTGLQRARDRLNSRPSLTPRRDTPVNDVDALLDKYAPK